MRFSDEERRIFRYFDGTQKRGIDPLEVAIAVEKVDLDWQATLSLVKADDRKIQLEAMEDLLKAAREVFGLKEFSIDQETDESIGVTGSEVIDILFDFMAWENALEKKVEQTATTQPSTEENQTTTKDGTGDT